MALEGASRADIVRTAASMAHRPVLLANLIHQVLVYELLDSLPELVVEAWRSVSHQTSVAGKTEHVQGAGGWLITPVGARGEIWGRLAMQLNGETPSDRKLAILERAAMALAMNRLAERDRQTLELQSHRSLLADVIAGTAPVEELEARAKALGVVVKGRALVACVIKLKDEPDISDDVGQESRGRDIGQWIAGAAREARVPVLISTMSSGLVGMLATFPNSSKVGPDLERLAKAVISAVKSHGEERPIIGVGSRVDSLREVRRSFREAEQVSDAADDAPQKAYYELPDIRIRGLMHLLRGDARVQTFCDRELGRLLALDRAESIQLIKVLKMFLEAAGNKSSAAAALRLSRPALYSKLTRIEEILGVNLETAESRLSLHLALIGVETSARHPA
jgi:purine catabolism regulator